MTFTLQTKLNLVLLVIQEALWIKSINFIYFFN